MSADFNSVISSGDLALLQPLWLLTLLPVWLWLWRQAKTSRPASPHRPTDIAFHPLLDLIPQTAPTNAKQQARRQRHTALRRPLHSIGITLLIIALAEPVRIGQRLPDPPPQRDIVFIVDSSVAMVLRDYSLDGQRLDRMSLLKALLRRFIDRLQGERIAVIVYGEHAYTLVPPSRDPALLRAMVARIQTTMAGRFSATGEAIALALRELSQPNTSASTSAGTNSPSLSAGQNADPRHQVIILLSAGGTPTGDIDARAAAKLVREQRIPLYTISIGAEHADAAEPRSTGLIYQPAGIQLLDTLANITGARRYTATDSAAIEQALQAIQQREGRPRPSATDHHRQALYPWPLLAGLLLLTLGSLIRPAARREDNDLGVAI